MYQRSGPLAPPSTTNGVNGPVASNTTQGEIVHRYNPSANINLHSGRVDFYASAWGSFGKDETTTGEQTRYEAADKELDRRGQPHRPGADDDDGHP